MGYHQIKEIKGKKHNYLIENIRIGKNKWKKIAVYLGKGNLTKKAVLLLIKKNRPKLEKKAYSYLKEHDPLIALLDYEELKELEQIRKKYAKAVESNEVVYYPNYEEAFITEFTYDSNAIEGSTLSLTETSLILYDKTTPKEKSLREVHEAENHKEAFDFIKNYRGDVTKQFVLDLHKKLMHNLLEKGAGEIRDVPVVIRGASFAPPPAKEAEEQFGDLIKWYSRNKKKYNPVILAAYTHVAFESIHPFRDGNGRAGRLLLNFILMKKGYPLINIKNKEKARYIEALEQGRRGDLRPFVNVILKGIKENKVVELLEIKKIGAQI